MTTLTPTTYRVAEVPRLLLTYEQAGEAIGVSERTIRAMVAEHELHAVRVTPQNPRIDPRELVEWIDRQMTKEQNDAH